MVNDMLIIASTRNWMFHYLLPTYDAHTCPGGGGVLPIMAYTGRLRPKGVPF